MHGRQLLNGFNEFELVVIHQKVDSVAVRATAKAMVELLFAVYGK